VAAAAARVAQSAPAAAAAASGGGGGGGSAGGAHMAHAGDAPGELMAGDTAAMAAANVTNAAIRAAEACPGGGPDNDTIAVVAGSLRGWYSNSRGKILPVRLTRHQLEQHPHSACAQLMKALKNPTTAPEEEWLQRTIFVRAAGFKTLKHGADSVINLIQPDGNKGITLMALFRCAPVCVVSRCGVLWGCLARLPRGGGGGGGVCVCVCVCVCARVCACGRVWARVCACCVLPVLLFFCLPSLMPAPYMHGMTAACRHHPPPPRTPTQAHQAAPGTPGATADATAGRLQPDAE
jgi:hypothetical protein